MQEEFVTKSSRLLAVLPRCLARSNERAKMERDQDGGENGGGFGEEREARVWVGGRRRDEQAPPRTGSAVLGVPGKPPELLPLLFLTSRHCRWGQRKRGHRSLVRS